jgi:SAM-dependent methyltransferase
VLTLRPTDASSWIDLLPAVISGGLEPRGADALCVPPDQLGAFRFYAGTALAARGDPRAPDWLGAAAAVDGPELRASEYVAGLLLRLGQLAAPVAGGAFTSPGAWIHFASLPALRAARSELVSFAVDSLPEASGSLSVLDVGCGDGGMLAELLAGVLAGGRFDEVASVTLLDPSRAMLERARARIASDWPGARVECLEARLQDVAGRLAGQYDLALGSLSLHHMPAERKRSALSRLAPYVDHLLLLELDADHDTPEVGSPRLAASVHETYGWLLAQVLGPGTPDDAARETADRFVAPELVSLLTEPRGVRSEYHMPRGAWMELLEEALGPDIRPLGVRTVLATGHGDLFALHMGRVG